MDGPQLVDLGDENSKDSDIDKQINLVKSSKSPWDKFVKTEPKQSKPVLHSMSASSQVPQAVDLVQNTLFQLTSQMIQPVKNVIYELVNETVNTFPDIPEQQPATPPSKDLLLEDPNFAVPKSATGGAVNQPPVKFCFNAIVKNESKCMLRRLNNIKNNIDAIAITDTGSTDDTVKIIEDFGKENNIPTRVDHYPFTNFEDARTKALEFGKRFTKTLPGIWYLMFGDADDLNFGGNPDHIQKLEEKDRPLFPQFDKTTFDANIYQVVIVSGSSKYIYTWMVRITDDCEYIWKSPVHECVMVKPGSWKPKDRLEKYGRVEGGYVESRREGSRTTEDDLKYYRDAITFERTLMSKPDCDKRRCTFYLAQSYRDCKMYDHAYKNYEHRTKMGGFIGEIYCSFKEMFIIRYNYKKKHDSKLVEIALRGIDVDPRRLEIPFHLIKYWNNTNQITVTEEEKMKELKKDFKKSLDNIVTIQKNPKAKLIEIEKEKWWDNSPKMHRVAWAFAQAFIDMKPIPDFLFIDSAIYDHLFYFEIAHSAYFCGEFKKSRDLFQKVLDSNLADANLRQKVKDFFERDPNLKRAGEEMSKPAEKKDIK